MSLAVSSFNVLANPVSVVDTLRARASRENEVIPFIIVVAIWVLLALAVTVVAAAIIMCATHGGVFDTVASIKGGFVSIKCHKL